MKYVYGDEVLDADGLTIGSVLDVVLTDDPKVLRMLIRLEEADAQWGDYRLRVDGQRIAIEPDSPA